MAGFFTLLARRANSNRDQSQLGPLGFSSCRRDEVCSAHRYYHLAYLSKTMVWSTALDIVIANDEVINEPEHGGHPMKQSKMKQSPPTLNVYSTTWKNGLVGLPEINTAQLDRAVAGTDIFF